MVNALSLTLAQANNPPQDDGATLLVWALALIGLALMLFMIEVFIPSGGLIGVASAVSLVAGIVLLFWENELWGLIGAAVSLIALPFALGFAIKMWPNTPIGRLLTLATPASRAEPHAADAPTKGAAAGLAVTVGQRGRAVTEMRPVGTCVFDGRREECLAAGGLIEPDTPVEIVAIDGRQIKVRPVTT
jgi:membrane-bound ClpP family serine protease